MDQELDVVQNQFNGKLLHLKVLNYLRDAIDKGPILKCNLIFFGFRI